MDERHRVAVVGQRVVDGLADESLRAELRDRLDPDADGAVVDRVVEAHPVFDELFHLLDLVSPGFPLDAGVDVLGVLPEGDHIHRLGVFHRRRDAVEVVGRPHVRVEIQLLAECDVQRAEARADRGRQRPFDRDAVLADGVNRLLWEVLAVCVAGGAAGVDAHPRDRAAGRLGGGVEYLLGGGADIGADPVAVDDRDDWRFGHVQLPGILVGERNLLALCGDLDLVVAHRRCRILQAS